MNLKNEIRKMDNLGELIDLEAFIRDCKTMLGKSTLRVGSHCIVVQKTKRTPGIIRKMNIKKAVVEMKGMSYNVPFAMLEAA